jgi:hypothetical protein
VNSLRSTRTDEFTPAQQHGLVADRDAGVGELLAGGARARRQLLGWLKCVFT